MEKVFALCRRTLLNRKRNDWSCYRTISIYRYKDDADKACFDLRQSALELCDDTVDYCVVMFNVIDLH